MFRHIGKLKCYYEHKGLKLRVNRKPSRFGLSYSLSKQKKIAIKKKKKKPQALGG